MTKENQHCHEKRLIDLSLFRIIGQGSEVRVLSFLAAWIRTHTNSRIFKMTFIKMSQTEEILNTRIHGQPSVDVYTLF